MRASGQLQRLVWRLRLQLRKSVFARDLVRRVRSMAPDTRDRHLRGEVAFWRRWLESEGLGWPEDYARRLDPGALVEEPLARIIDLVEGPTVHILDVGAGLLTVVGKVHPSKALAITATDVLARDYDELLLDFGIRPPVRTIHAEAEKLCEQLGGRQFDIVHAQNSLDHCADPFAALDQMIALTRDGGFVVLVHQENVGRNELYHALHKWDFTCESGRFIVAGPGPDGPRRDVTSMLAGRAVVECSIDAGEVLVIMRKPRGRENGR